MRMTILGVALSLVGAVGVWADEERMPESLGTESLTPSAASLGLPTSLRDEVDAERSDDDKDDDRRPSDRVEFSIGPMGGFLKAREADRGTWFAGVQARLRFLRILAVEGAISFHQNEYADGDVVVTQYPVQVSVLLLPFPHGAFDPYVLAGGGWYYSRIDYDDSIGGGDDTDRMFGGHVGAGTNIRLSKHISLFGDFRWVFLDEPGVDNSNLRNEKFDYWHVTFGLSFGF